jgi:RNA polymerase subunit RPABC4/transcription elongation factor Spt4
MQTTDVRCNDCHRMLDEQSSGTPRQPCPHCGSLRRTFEKTGTVAVGTAASVTWSKISERVRRNWPWLIAATILTLAGSLVGLVIGGVIGAIVGLALGITSIPASQRAHVRIREIEHGPRAS